MKSAKSLELWFDMRQTRRRDATMTSAPPHRGPDIGRRKGMLQSSDRRRVLVLIGGGGSQMVRAAEKF